MPDHVETERSVSEADGPVEKFFYFVLLNGDRLLISAVMLAAVFGALWFLTESGYFAVGPSSIAGSLFASGLTSGVLTVVTLILSINQLILSRVFGSPEELSSKLQGTREFRGEIERLADLPSTPNDPAAFLAVVGETLENRASDLKGSIAGVAGVDESVDGILGDVAAYGASLDGKLEAQTPITDVLVVILGTEYATNMTAVHHANNVADEHLDDGQRERFDALEDLLGSIAISRQFFKTLALQRDFARLSRITAVTGLAAFFATISLSLVYQSSAVTIDPVHMPLVATVGLTIIATPVVVVIAYVLRAATVARHTVSVGPFVPPGE